ncbi:MAG TPA: hypothetical protein DDY17_05605 [Syntrophaceae bacterium]|jgi:hypothetical protein|nr:hypothetical protein [Syntrophaceae bacterium]
MIKTIKLFKQGIPVALLSFVVMIVILQLTPPVAAAERVGVNAELLSPFYLNGKTYIFGKQIKDMDHAGAYDNAANWWVIKDNPKDGLTPVAIRKKMSSSYQGVAPFTLKNKQYIFGLHTCKAWPEWGARCPSNFSDYNANIWRIDIVNGAATGWTLVKINGKMASGKMSPNYNAIVSYQLNGIPYILGLHRDVGANIWRITQTSDGVNFELVKYKAAQMSGAYCLTVFYKDGHPYIYEGMNIWRVKGPPNYGLELVKKGVFLYRYNFVKSFHIGGQPYLFAAAQPPDKYKEISIPTSKFAVFKSILDTPKNVYDCLANQNCGLYQPGKGFGVIYKIEADYRITQMSPRIPISNHYRDMTTFEQGGKAYIFGCHREKYANIWRVNDNLAAGFSLVYYGNK